MDKAGRKTAEFMYAFFKLPNLDKLKVVEAINEYFDSNEREIVRSKWESELADAKALNEECIFCGRRP